jgi:peptidoglycan/LPS O-acetylase OafA/YrhL
MSKPDHIRALDGVRGVAALMVMAFHLTQGRGAEFKSHLGGAAKLLGFGQTGVSLFFVLSGFLITRILLSSKESKHYFSDFFIRRSLRIFPLYFFSLGLWFFVLPYLDSSHQATLRQGWWYWVYLQNIASTFQIDIGEPGHFWSLAVEEHFYLAWPFAVWAASILWLRRIAWLTIGFAILSRYALVSLGYNAFGFTTANADALVMGGLLAIHEPAVRKSPRAAGMFALLFVTLLPALILVWTRYSGSHEPWLQVIKGTLIASIYTSALGMILADSTYSRWINKALSAKWLTSCGLISYGLYIYHPTCYHYCLYIPHQRWFIMDLAIPILVSLVCAMLSYRFVELPFLRLKGKFTH